MADTERLTRDLRGKWYRGYGVAPCPVCQTERRKGQNALTLADGEGGRLLLNCKKYGCAFRDILAAAGIAPGSYLPPDPATIARRNAEQREDEKKRAAQAHRLWQEAQPITGTLAERPSRNRSRSASRRDRMAAGLSQPMNAAAAAARFPAFRCRVSAALAMPPVL